MPLPNRKGRWFSSGLLMFGGSTRRNGGKDTDPNGQQQKSAQKPTHLSHISSYRKCVENQNVSINGRHPCTV